MNLPDLSILPPKVLAALAGILLLSLVLAAYFSRLVLEAKGIDRLSKTGYLLMLWGIPAIGTIIATFMIRRHLASLEREEKRLRRTFGRGRFGG